MFVVVVVLGTGACFTTDLIYTRFKDFKKKIIAVFVLFFVVVLGRGECFTADLIYTCFKDCFVFVFCLLFCCCFVFHY